MTIKELSNLFYIDKEIKKLESELKEISAIGSIVIDGMPRNSSYSDKVQNLVIKRQNLIDKIVKKQVKYIEEKVKMENFIDTIDDPKIRLIVRLRFVEFRSWYEIADEITPYGKDLTDRTSPYNALKRYFEKNDKMSHMSH